MTLTRKNAKDVQSAWQIALPPAFSCRKWSIIKVTIMPKWLEKDASAAAAASGLRNFGLPYKNLRIWQKKFY